MTPPSSIFPIHPREFAMPGMTWRRPRRRDAYILQERLFRSAERRINFGRIYPRANFGLRDELQRGRVLCVGKEICIFKQGRGSLKLDIKWGEGGGWKLAEIRRENLRILWSKWNWFSPRRKLDRTRSNFPISETTRYIPLAAIPGFHRSGIRSELKAGRDFVTLCPREEPVIF